MDMESFRVVREEGGVELDEGGSSYLCIEDGDLLLEIYLHKDYPKILIDLFNPVIFNDYYAAGYITEDDLEWLKEVLPLLWIEWDLFWEVSAD